MKAEPPIVTPELCAALGAREVVGSNVGPTIAGVTPANLSQFAFELVRAVSTGALHPDKCAVAVKAAGIEASDQVAATIADMMWYVWVEAEGAPGAEAVQTRLADLGRAVMRDGLVSRRLLMEVSEGEFLEWAGLVVSYTGGWRKKEIQKNTRHVYTQRKFNLLREESEGYAKLVVLLNQAGAGALNEERVDAVLGEIKSLIGYFDLDPNRAFSLVLDAFAAQPHNDAFLHLLPAFSPDAVARLLGFHFARPADQPPEGLYLAAAKLVAHGAVSLEALLAHVGPSDEAITAAATDGKAAFDLALTRIGVISLTDSAPRSGQDGGGEGGGEAGAGPGRRRTGQSAADLQLDALPYAAHLIGPDGGERNQRLRLLAALLRVGAWDQATRLMRWLAALGLTDVGIFPAVGKAMCGLVAAELAPQYALLHPGGLRGQMAAAGSRPPQASTPAPQLGPRLLEVLQVLGHHLYHDVATLTRLVRVVGGVIDATEAGTPPRAAALEVLAANVLPAAALLPAFPALVMEVWDAMARLPYPQRFSAYGDLREAAAHSPLLTAAGKLAEVEVRRILRRVTAPTNKRDAKVTMRPLGRMLAKIVHASPLPAAEQLLRQVMGMPGMVASVAESLRFLTPMAFDVATFATLRQLSSPKRKLKEDGVNLEEWFQWLAAFTGLMCRNYEDVELTSLLQYVANQLKCCESLDLLVLKEVVTTMTGVQAVFDVSDTQLDALAGSDTLRAEVITQQEAGRGGSERAVQRGAQRLLRALRTGPPEQQLAMPLLILLAQQRKLITLQPQSSHLKLVAELYDKCHETTVQYAELLRNVLPRAEYQALLPSVKALAHEFKIDPEIIFELHRPLIRDIHPPPVPVDPATPGGAASSGDRQDDDDEEGEIAGDPSTVPPPPPQAAAAETEAAQAMDVEDGEVEAGPERGEADPAVGAAGGGGGRPAWEALAAEAASLGPEGGFKGMSHTLYVTFWALALYDLQVPEERYDTVLGQLRSAARATREDLEAARRGYGVGMMGGGLGGGAAVDVEQLTRDLERAETAAAKLPAELKAQQANAAAVGARLVATRGAWLAEDKSDKGQAAAAREFVQHCVLPRVLNSPADAMYCARFLHRAHALGPPGFRLLSVMDRLFKELGFLVRCSTPREATNLGIFFAELMTLVAGWRVAGTYARECASAEAFRTYKAGLLSSVSHPEFVKLSANWHRKLTTDVFGSCLASADYMQMKNALLVLNRMVRVFPATREDAGELLRAAGPIRDGDPREDLKTLARMYCTTLEMAMRGGVAAASRAVAMVDSRQEYAGLRPPKKKNRPPPPPPPPDKGEEPAPRRAPPGFVPVPSSTAKEAVVDAREQPDSAPAHTEQPPPTGAGRTEQQPERKRERDGERPRQRDREKDKERDREKDRERDRERPSSASARSGGREAKEERPPRAPLRADAAPFAPSSGPPKDNGRARAAELQAEQVERESKRARVDSAAPAAPKEARPAGEGRSGRERSSRGAEVAGEAREEDKAPRRRRDEPAAPRSQPPGDDAARTAEGEVRATERSRRGTTDREVEQARAAARAAVLPEQPPRRPPSEHRRDQEGGRQAERPPSRHAAPPAAEAKDRSEAGQERGTRSRAREPEREERVRGRGEAHAREPAAVVAAPEQQLAEGEGRGADKVDGDREGSRKRHRKDRKKEKRDKSSRRGRERSGEGGGAGGAGAEERKADPGEERETKRRKQEVPASYDANALPARLRDRLGSSHAPPQEAPAEGRRSEAGRRERNGRRHR